MVPASAGDEMDRAQIHFEVFARRQQGSSWTLELASEDRAKALQAAEDMFAEGRAIAVKVAKETLAEGSNEFKSVVILTKGAPDSGKAKKPREELEPLCVSPQDLYSGHARRRIGRLLEGWLARNRATAFELLHRPDLAEKLDASGLELQHAIQKVSIPEAQARKIRVHEVIRVFQRLAQAAIERVLTDARKGALPKIEVDGFAGLAERLSGEPERHYLLGAAVARLIGGGSSWRDKVNRILDLADAAPASPQARNLAFHVLEEPLAEVLGSKAGLGDLVGEQADLGSSLAAMTRLAAAEQVERLAAIEPAVARALPPLEGAAARLANWLDGPYFEHVRAAIARRVLKELMGPRRLRPLDPEAEIIMLRALAMALTASAGRLLSLEEVQEAFTERSRMLLRPDFVEVYLAGDRSPLTEVEALLWLAENVTGAANKRQACRWIAANVSALRFETAILASPDTVTAKLLALTELQRSVARAGFAAEDAEPIAARIGEVGGMVEAAGKLTASLARSGAPLLSRLTLLLQLAAGQAAPHGLAADRAKTEVLRLMRNPENRQALAQAPERLEQVRDLMQTAGLAA
jgi:hypothetical protein